ncbi:hypothetical protein BHE74_00007330 [Ensete ventricosum]|nr:hypothetical protein BHE74_00007330 [Ensete ventricosum]RZR88073.1 hypothetical protein BHM03_00015587 [Ensete ventricosum]
MTLVVGGGDNKIRGRRKMQRYGPDAGRSASWGSSSAGRPGGMKARAKRQLCRRPHKRRDEDEGEFTIVIQ